MTDPFRVLLNRISAQLNEQEIRSLMLMCDVPRGLQADIKDGISLFDNLIKRDIINHQKLDKLKTMLKNLSAKRRDLIKEIENFEAADETSSTVTSIVSVRSFEHVGTSDVKKSCCSIECPCMVITCYKCKYSCKISWSYVVAAVMFSICFLICALFWYADVPEASEKISSNESMKKAGPYILIGIFVLFVLCLCSIHYLMRVRRRSKNIERTAENEIVLKEKRTRSVMKNVKDNRPGTPNFRFSQHVDDEDIVVAD